MPTARITARLLRSALPDVTRTRRLAGLEAPVTIYRDAHGIPHVRARTAGELRRLGVFVTLC